VSLFSTELSLTEYDLSVAFDVRPATTKKAEMESMAYIKGRIAELAKVDVPFQKLTSVSDRLHRTSRRVELKTTGPQLSKELVTGQL
jgi:hypothetical protein